MFQHLPGCSEVPQTGSFEEPKFICQNNAEDLSAFLENWKWLPYPFSIYVIDLIYSVVGCHLPQMFFLSWILPKEINKAVYVCKHTHLSLRIRLWECVESLKETGNSFEWPSLHPRAVRGLAALACPGENLPMEKERRWERPRKIITKTLMWKGNANNFWCLVF